MKKLVNGETEELFPPTEEEIKKWHTFYLCYFNSEFSLEQGRRLPKELCVKNPRPDEISDALKQLGYRSILHHEKKHPCDFLHAGRLKFRIPQGDKQTKKKIMREVGKIIIGSKTRIDPELCVQKEKEGLFDMVAEEKAIA